MTKDQLKRANSVAYPVLLVIMGYVFLSLIAFIALTDQTLVTWRAYIQMLSALLGIMISTVLFIAKRDTMLCAKGMLLSAAVMYAIIRMFGTTEDSCMYAFPILFVAMVYLNQKIIVIGNCFMIGSNLIRLLMRINNLHDNGGQTLVVSVCVCLLVAYSSIRITRLLIKFNGENMETILEASKKQEESQNLLTRFLIP
ncbi:MAG: hypothetical protein MR531_14715 [Lachnospiraceae bacterium]|nr:hypothetical protein [Lachnospiraceae bacterium]